LPRSPALGDGRRSGAGFAPRAGGLPPRAELPAGFVPRLGAAFLPVPVAGFALREAGLAPPRATGPEPRLGWRSEPGFELARVDRGAPLPEALGLPRPLPAPAPRPARPGCARPWPPPRLRLSPPRDCPSATSVLRDSGGTSGHCRSPQRKRSHRRDEGAPQECPLVREIPAATYSPGGLPPKYHRRGRSSLPCSEWERVFPRRNCHRKPGFQKSVVLMRTP
jgi:hypothetical protein